MTSAPTTKALPGKRRYTTRTILIAVALGAGVGVVLIPLNFASLAMTSTMPVVVSITYVVFGMAALIPLALLRLPGIGIIGSTAAGVVSALSPYGLMTVVMMFCWGILMEVPFVITRYRTFSMPMFFAAGTVLGIATCWMSYTMLNMAMMETTAVVFILAIQLASSIACTAGSLTVARALTRAGIAGRNQATR